MFGKIGECSGLSKNEKAITTPKLTKITPLKPTNRSEFPLRDGVFEEPPKTTPQKQVWIAKPNHLRNPLDAMPDISSDSLPKKARDTQPNKRVP